MATSRSGLLAACLPWVMVRRAEKQARREERLTAEKRRAESADREKSNFLATMSHEIRTPMNAILSFGELLLEEAATNKEKRYPGSIVRSGNSLLQIINDILDLSKIEADMMDIVTSATDVREAASFVQLLFAHYPSESRSRFALLIEVEDTGIGIPADKLQEIFKPFVQATARRDVALRVTGLGLAIVKRLIEPMDGDIKVRSESNVGSIFRVEFPELEVSARLPQTMSTVAAHHHFHRLQHGRGSGRPAGKLQRLRPKPLLPRPALQ